MSTPQPRTLPELMAALHPAMQAVDAAEAQLRAVKDETRRNRDAAATRRNVAIARAESQRAAAQADYDQAVCVANQEHAVAVDTARVAQATAEATYGKACAVADPMLQELRATQERVAAVAARR